MEHILQDFINILRQYPQLLVFAALAVGYFIGKIKIFDFKLGSTAGVLLAALVIGQVNVAIPGLLKTVAFALFIFTIGYKVGPEFISGLKKEGIHYIILSVVVAAVGLAVAYTLAKLLHFDPGTAAGMLGGAMTQSAIIGTADSAIRHLAIPHAQQNVLENNIAIAYAITYIFGTAGLIVFFKLAPKFLRIDLKQQAKELVIKMAGNEKLDPELFSWHKQLNLRIFQVTNKDIFGQSIAQIVALFPEHIVIEKIKRNSNIFTAQYDTIIEENDMLTIIANREDFDNATKIIGPEVADKMAADILGEILEVVVLNKAIVGKTLGEISEHFGKHCFLRKITRQEHNLPLTRNTVVHKCDVLTVAGPQIEVEKMTKQLGHPHRATTMTDLIMVGIGCFLGTLLGLASIKIGDIPITLGIGGGVLVAGLIAGWLRSLHPTFGQIPTSAQWIFTDLGLNLFIACVGIVAGPQALHALQTTGLSLFLAGIAVTLLPTIAGLLFGKFILRINPVLLLGALTGAGTITAALNALKEEAGNSAPALGYTVPYAFGNVLLTVWGTVIVHLIH